MQRINVQVFEQAPAVFQLRVSTWNQDGFESQQELDASALEALLDHADVQYDTAAQGLISLGRELYGVLDDSATRWLTTAREGARDGIALGIDVDQGLRHLPWELLADGSGFLCAGNFSPVRRVSGVAAGEASPENRPLRVLFMACSPEDVLPVLDFEAEEGEILSAMGVGRRRALELDLAVEESGSLNGLAERIADHPTGYYDVFHLSGHAELRGEEPVFVMEDDLGLRRDATAQQLSDAFGGRWPRLVFLSGCETGRAADVGAVPSLCERLVAAGATSVLGWALPVGDRAAIDAAADLYRRLAAGDAIDEAVAQTRRSLLASDAPSPYWHLLRLYADATPLDPIVTPPATGGRERLSHRAAEHAFLDARPDALKGRIAVCRREDFIGRRRVVQRALRTLLADPGSPKYAEGVALQGTAGLGKSSTAARLCDRLPEMRRVVNYGAADEAAFLHQVAQAFPEDAAVTGVMNEAAPLSQRLAELLRGPLAGQPTLFVFDDFEQNLESTAAGDHAMTADAATVLNPLLAAIRTHASLSRVIVTSRYGFEVAGPSHLETIGLPSMREAELTKKLRQLPALGGVEERLLTRALELGGGNPRLLEWLDAAVADADTDHAKLLDAITGVAVTFREAAALANLLEQLGTQGEQVLTYCAIYDLPVSREAFAAAVGELSLAPHLDRAVRLGIVEAGREVATGEELLYVSPVARPMLQPLDGEELVEAAGRAARHLYEIWWNSP